MSKDFLLTDEELIIEFEKIKTEELNTALAFLQSEFDENRLKLIYEQSQQTSITHFPSLIDSVCNKKSVFVESNRGTIMFYIEQRKALKFLSCELSRRIQKLHWDHSTEISTFNNLFS